MLDIKPFKGTRPHNELAEKLIAPSTDYLSEEGIIDIHEKHYWNYLKILNPVGKNKEEESLKIAKDQFKKMKDNHIVKQDSKPCYYIYRIKTSDHCQTGFLSIVNIKSFVNNEVKGHELTYEKRMQERADQMLNLQTQIGPIYVSYKDDHKLDQFIEQQTLFSPQYDFTAFDNSQHTLWCLEDDNIIKKITNLANELDSLYIADGHHRMGAMNKLYTNNESKKINNNSYKYYDYFMIAAFPKSQSKIYDYNRVIKDLNNLSIDEFILKLSENFNCEKSSIAIRPKKSREFGMFHDNTWYILKFNKENLLKNDILSKLDINIINEFCLKPILGIKDVNIDERIRFIAGSHGLIALEKKVMDNPNSVAFSIFPTTIEDVIEVANNKLTMPPKSTWFDPKPLDGLVVYEFEQNHEK